MEGLFIGLMSGTSLDGVDGVLCSFAVSPEPVHVHAHVYRPFDPELVTELLALNTPGDNELHRAALVANRLVRACADVVRSLLSDNGTQPESVVAIGAHGQTVRHRPGEFDATGYTVQINAPALLAELTGVSVVADFRTRDVAAGGQGAPLVPAFHRAVFARADRSVCVLNLGGISNLTVLHRDGATVGFDCGPGNALMDYWCQRHTGQPFDDEGDWAATGHVNEGLLADMLAEPYFARRPPKSTGRDLFNPAWLESSLRRHSFGRPLPARDVQATLAELTARTCAEAVLQSAPMSRDLLACGGGAANRGVLARLAANLPEVAVSTTEASGLPPNQVEACAFAWLARAWFMQQAGNLPRVTGAHGPRILGALYPC